MNEWANRNFKGQAFKIHKTGQKLNCAFFNVDFESIISRLPPRSIMTAWDNFENGTLNCKVTGFRFGVKFFDRITG